MSGKEGFSSGRIRCGFKGINLIPNESIHSFDGFSVLLIVMSVPVVTSTSAAELVISARPITVGM